MTQKLQLRDVTVFPPLHRGEMINPQTKHVCYRHESYTELSGPDFIMEETVFITHTHTHTVTADLLDKLDVKIDAEHPGGW